MRRLLRAAVILAAIVAVGLLLVWQALRGGHAREAVEARLTATLGQPVSIGRLNITLFPRLAISGHDVRLGEAAVQAPGLAVDRVLILPRLGPLLTGEVVVRQIHLDGFTMAMLRDDEGRWHVPSVVPAPTPGEGGDAVIERVRVTGGHLRVFDGTPGGEVRETAGIHDLEADVTVEEGGLRFSPITGRIGSAEISGEARSGPRAIRLEFTAGRIDDDDVAVLLALLGGERPAFLRLAEPASISGAVHVDRSSSRLSGEGVLRAPEVLFEPVRLQGLEAPFAIEGSHLRFDPMTFEMYGGTHQGNVTIQVGDRSTWANESRVTGLDVGEFLDVLTGTDQRLDGTAAVSAGLRGRIDEPLDETVTGRLELVVTDGIIRDFPLLQAINRVLQLADDAGGDTRFERLSATFAIASGQATTENLQMTAEHITVRAAGRLGADRTVALRGVAAVSPDRSARAIASVRELSGLRNARGEIELPLTVSGTLDAPSFGLDLKAAIGKGIRDELERRLRGIIRK